MARWQIILPMAMAILGFVSAKPTTQETLVVSRHENEESTTPIPTSDVTSEEPNPPIKMTDMDVQSKISLRYAYTEVVTRVRNPAKRAQETTFRMLLPDTAFISGFTMTINGKAYKAYVKEKEEAKQIYSDAVSQGLGAAHVAAKARDSNHFTVNVNVEPNSTVMFNLTYEELLVRRNGLYNHDVNLHPGTLVPNMKVTVQIKEAAKISVLRVPEIRTGNEVEAMENDPQNTKAVVTKTHDDREATITFNPDLNEQKRLMQVYAEKSKESLENVYPYYPEDENKDKEGVLGQFVVQYDVDRPEGGEILVNDGYFVHFFAPQSLPPLPKHVVFVLDTSGSMMGRKIEQLRSAMTTILDKLNEHDYFSIVEFNTYVKVLDIAKADELEKPTRWINYDRAEETKLLPPSPASSANIANAKLIISRLDAGGGTNIASALDVAVDLTQKGVGWRLDTHKTENKNASASDNVYTNATTTDVSTSTTAENKLEPIIIFLTDGDPTVGETDPTRIISRLSEKNFGDQKALIFSLAFGGDADRKFLRKLSLRNDGFMRHIYDAADAALQLQDFYRSVSSPLLANVKFLYPKNQIKEKTLSRNTFRTYYAGSEMVVAGELQDTATEIESQVLAFCGLGDGVGRKRYEISPKVPVSNTHSYFPLERLWAYLAIKQLLDEKEVVDKNQAEERKKELDKKALEIALKYEMVTPLTSLVVVKPNDTKAVDAESVDDNPMAVPFDRPQAFLALSAVPAMDPAAYALSAVDSAAYAFSPLDSGAYGKSRPKSAPIRHLIGFPGLAGSLPVSDLMPELAFHSIALDEDYEDSSGKGIFLSVKPPQVTDQSTTPLYIPTTEQTSTTRNPLEQFSLQEYPWALQLFDAASESLVVQLYGTQVHLKLTKDIDSLASSGTGACGNGTCVYLTRCLSARNFTAAIYETAFCIYDNGYAGVCCPEQDESHSP